MELRTQCSAYYVQQAGAGLEPCEMKLTGSPGTSKFPTLSIIYSNCYYCWYAVLPDQTWRTTDVEYTQWAMKRTILGLQIIHVGFEGFSQALFTWKKSNENIAYVIALQGTVRLWMVLG